MRIFGKTFITMVKITDLTDVASNFDFISKRCDATRAALRFLSSNIVAKGVVQT